MHIVELYGKTDSNKLVTYFCDQWMDSFLCSSWNETDIKNPHTI